MITGTLAGVADYLNIDPTIVRVVFVFISLMGMGSPILFYIVMALIIPSADKSGDYNAGYGNDNTYYQSNHRNNSRPTNATRKEAERVDEDDWSDF